MNMTLNELDEMVDVCDKVFDEVEALLESAKTCSYSKTEALSNMRSLIATYRDDIIADYIETEIENDLRENGRGRQLSGQGIEDGFEEWECDKRHELIAAQILDRY